MFQGFGIARLHEHQSSVAQSLERLATGKRINRASDDPSGMIAATDFKVQLHTLEKKLKGFERESSWLGAREGALSVMSDFMVELNGLVVQGANKDALSPEERDAITLSVESIISGINHTANTTRFGGEALLSGLTASQLGRQQIDGGVDEDGNPLDDTSVSLADLPELIFEDPKLAQSILEDAESTISGQRGAIGNKLRSLDSQRSALMTEYENVAGALSLIEDTDFAKETSELVRSQILEQSTIAAIKMGQQNAARILDLITPLTENNIAKPI